MGIGQFIGYSFTLRDSSVVEDLRAFAHPRLELTNLHFSGLRSSHYRGNPRRSVRLSR